ncbi:Flp family type IVb pilin [Schauerella aestuarii]|uniref:Flp family type IVb pilin n=1 Tax=Schauerella aestuarii TaxID=2511204 RepID=UPI00137159AD|nr:Flp family type IVb pilin [Achromobacter aestuarii]MYZ45341.1 Flp family type IVb pilin [Achromobacter aestuarii]
MKAQLLKFWNEEDGASAIEYGLLVGVLVLGIVVALGTFSGTVNAFFKTIGERVTSSLTSGSTTTPPATGN